jgi:glycosyltransferase involved in cell wall biosynthesis
MAIFVGRFIPTKRICDLIDALAMLPASQYRLRTILVGNGRDEESIANQVRSLGLTDAVQFAGLRGDVPQLLQAADVFVFPSEVEGLPNAVIEAALAGLPIVACDIPGVRDIVMDDANSALAVPRSPRDFAAALRRVLENLEEARRRARVVQQSAVRKYSIDVSLDKLYGVYDAASLRKR